MGREGGQHDGSTEIRRDSIGHMIREEKIIRMPSGPAAQQKGQQRSDARNGDRTRDTARTTERVWKTVMSHGHEKHKGKGGSSGGSD